MNAAKKSVLAIALLSVLASPVLAQERALPVPIPPGLRDLVVEVTAIQRFGPAYRAGLEVGDRILAVDSTRVQSLNELRRQLQAAGESARLTVQNWRTGKVMSVYVYPEDGRIGIDARMVEAYPYQRYPY